MPARPQPAPPPLPLGQRFKPAIEKAVLEGVAPSALLLNLTRADASKLKRDQTIPTEDISFAGGKMSYCGVPVAEGDVAASVLVGWPPTA